MAAYVEALERVGFGGRNLNQRRFEQLIGKSRTLDVVLDQVERVAPTDSTVLIQGETGTGKELIARAVHNVSSRCGRPFIKLNCAAIPDALLESELFGHERGAFTAAIAQKVGRFEMADKGTLFLDEVGDIPLALQPKLLRVLQEQEFERLGGTRTHQVDVRLVAATNRDLAGMVKRREFRDDLYYRLNVIHITVPPLRARREDIPFLAEHFVKKLKKDLGTPVESISEAAIQRLLEYHWPGNVRELENVIERSMVLGSGAVLEAADIKLDVAPKPRLAAADNFLPDGMTLDDYERSIIREALHRANGNKSQAARLLGLTRNALRYRLSQMGIES